MITTQALISLVCAKHFAGNLLRKKVGQGRPLDTFVLSPAEVPLITKDLDTSMEGSQAQLLQKGLIHGGHHRVQVVDVQPHLTASSARTWLATWAFEAAFTSMHSVGGIGINPEEIRLPGE